jgi:hypothetical protein
MNYDEKLYALYNSLCHKELAFIMRLPCYSTICQEKNPNNLKKCKFISVYPDGKVDVWPVRTGGGKPGLCGLMG